MADIILILIVAFFTYMGAKRGLVKTLVGAVSTLISLMLSMLLYQPVSQMLYNSSLGDGIRKFVEEFLTKKLNSGVGLFMLEQAIETSTVLVMNVISFISVILAVKLIVIIFANILNITAKLPIIKQANKLLGMAAGALSGILVCYIIIGIIAALGAEGNISLMQESIKNSYFAINMYDNNFIANILSGFTR